MRLQDQPTQEMKRVLRNMRAAEAKGKNESWPGKKPKSREKESNMFKF